MQKYVIHVKRYGFLLVLLCLKSLDILIYVIERDNLTIIVTLVFHHWFIKKLQISFI